MTPSKADSYTVKLRNEGLVAFNAFCKASSRPETRYNKVAKEFFALGFATAKTEEFVRARQRSPFHKLRRRFTNWFLSIFTCLVLSIPASAACPKKLIAAIYSCDVTGCKVQLPDGTFGKAALPVAIGEVVEVCPL